MYRCVVLARTHVHVSMFTGRKDNEIIAAYKKDNKPKDDMPNALEHVQLDNLKYSRAFFTPEQRHALTIIDHKTDGKHLERKRLARWAMLRHE